MSPRARNAFVALNCLLIMIQQSTTTNKYPSSSEIDTRSELSSEDKEKFLDEHNNLRGIVEPPAADMEYLVWSEDLASLAQMWADRCRYEHGYLEFGPYYPNAPFKGQMGQNIAREWGTLKNPVDRVNRWFNERQYYKYDTGFCSKDPCGHYTQVAWSSSKYLGCGLRWCDTYFGSKPHPRVRGETLVICDYAPAGNVQGKKPYKVGKPCTKCASGNGFCYKNLCRDCEDFSGECGKSLTTAMCTTDKELMSKKCPKMCNLCECPLTCQNGGTLNTGLCNCQCPSGFKGLDCSEKPCPPGYYGENCELRCYDRKGKETCEWRVANGHDCKAAYMEKDCAKTCGYCGVKPTPVPAPASPAAPAPPTLPIQPSTAPPVTGATVPPATAQPPAVLIPAHCTDKNFQCPYWAAFGLCEKNPAYMFPYCCESCRGHTKLKECKDNSDDCPLLAFASGCERRRSWMMRNCQKSCYQCGECKDLDAQCPAWALMNRCSLPETKQIMTTTCRDSCGMCKVYDRFDKCPAWAATGACKGDRWVWMRKNCPDSCHVPYSESTFCEGKSNGNYPVDYTCVGYIACSWSITTHVHCPTGKRFEKNMKVCINADSIICGESEVV